MVLKLHILQQFGSLFWCQVVHLKWKKYTYKQHDTDSYWRDYSNENVWSKLTGDYIMTPIEL